MKTEIEIYPPGIEQSIESASLENYKCVMGTGSNFRAGIDFIIKYLRAHPEKQYILTDAKRWP